MTPRDVVLDALAFRRPAYVPWDWGVTERCAERLRRHLGSDDLDGFIGPHFATFGQEIGFMTPVADGFVRDEYGVVWDRRVDRDIGTPSDWPIRDVADLAGYRFPQPPEAWFAGLDRCGQTHAGLFRRYAVGFSLYERAWTLRGMSQLLMDMLDRPAFVEDLLDRIVEHNLQVIRQALRYDIDCVHFGDDYGMQSGLIMGLEHWRRFIKPRLQRMFEPVRQAGKFVSMHSCGQVSSLLGDLVEIGLNLFNPFQPEVMDVQAILPAWHGRLAFHGGMSVQKVLPFGSAAAVKAAASELVALGRQGGYVFAPSHQVPPDVPPENLVAMMEVLRGQAGAP